MKQKKTKRQYRLRNWKEYNKALVRRGSLTLWVSDDMIAHWRETQRTGKRGAPRSYTETAILCMATLQEVYHLPLRATEGLMLSVVHLLGVDQATHEFVAVVVSTNDFKDSQLLPDLPAQVEDEISQVSADGAYGSRNCYDAIREREARAAIPPQKRAKIWQHGNTKRERHIRDENLRAIRRQGRAAWKRESNYHRRSLAETQVFRVKMIFGERVSARSFEGQSAQMLVRCATLNRMTHLGMPDSYAA